MQLIEAMGAASRLHYNVSLHGIYKAFERKQCAQSLLRGLPNNVLCGRRTLLNKSQPTEVRERLTSLP
jgi:hypothetical protein